MTSIDGTHWTASIDCLDLDEHGDPLPLTAEQSVRLCTEWALEYPTARFAVLVVAPDGSDAEVLGWGLALPEHVFVDLPQARLTGHFQSAERLCRLLRHLGDVRVVWVDPQPDPAPADAAEAPDDRGSGAAGE